MSNSEITVFGKTDGTTTDSLTLTKPGTAGALNYQYVGSGFWQRTQIGAGLANGAFDAFIFGLPSADGALLRRGGAAYAVDLLGVTALYDNLYAMRGTGLLTVNFLTGEIKGGSTRLDGVTLTPVNGNSSYMPSGSWNLAANLASTTNAINGLVTILGGSPSALTGPATGRLFGPNSEEIGFSFAANNSFGESSVGTLLGNRSSDTIAADNPSLADLQFDQKLSPEDVSYSDIRNDMTGAAIGNEGLYIPHSVELAYRASDQARTIRENASLALTTAFLPSDIQAAQSSALYTLYERQEGSDRFSLKQYNAGIGNTELALTYSSFAQFTHTAPNPSNPGFTTRQISVIALGLTTPMADVPRTGTANYAGILRGVGISRAYTGFPVMALEGTANFAIDFGLSRATGVLTPILVDPRDGTRLALGVLTSTETYRTAGVGQIIFGGVMSGSSTVTDAATSMRFIGPHAEEIAGTFNARYVIPGPNGSVLGNLIGAVVGKKEP